MEERIQKLEDRNLRVEADKAWEVSFTRRFFIAVVTYFIAGIWLVMIKDSVPWLKAFVPAVGYLLSTQSLPFIKKWWIKNHIK